VRYDDITMVIGNGVVLTVRYECRFANSLDGAALMTDFYDGVSAPPRSHDIRRAAKARVLEVHI